MSLINTGYFDSLAAQINAAPDCQKLSAIAEKAMSSLVAQQTAVMQQMVDLAPLEALLKPPTSPPQVVTWVEHFIAQEIEPGYQAYLNYVQQVAAIQAAAQNVVQAIQSASERFASCGVAVPDLTALPTNPTLGQQFFDTASNSFVQWNGTAWEPSPTVAALPYTDALDPTVQAAWDTANVALSGVDALQADLAVLRANSEAIAALATQAATNATANPAQIQAIVDASLVSVNQSIASTEATATSALNYASNVSVYVDAAQNAANSASSNASIAATYANEAATSASTASTQAGYAGANAAVAISNANLSASYAGQAATSASTASTQAGYASANAATATSQASLAVQWGGWAQANAQAAQSNATAAQSNATTAQVQAGYASANAAAAGSSATTAANWAGYAQSNASSAANSATWAQSNATSAQTSVTYAASNASLASSNATLAASYAGQASSNAAAAANSATWAQSNATSAATSVTYASSNASLASSNATLAASYAGQASSNAAAAANSATWAQSNATAAATSVTYASSNASIAASNASLAASYAGQASSNASVASNQAAYASANAAFAQSNATIAASIGMVSLNDNPAFSIPWTNGSPPPNWVNWSNVSVSKEVTGTVSPYAIQFPVPGGVNSPYGITQFVPHVYTGYYVLEADVTLVSGSLKGAGMDFWGWNTANVNTETANLTFGYDPDISGSIHGDGVAGQTYRFSKLVQLSNTNTVAGNLDVAARNPGYSANTVATTINFNKALIRPATAGEIQIGQAVGSSTLSATLTQINNTVANNNAAVTSQLTTLSAQVASNPNLLPYGNFEAGTTGWTGWEPGAQVYNNPQWGWIAFTGQYANGVFGLFSEQVPLQPGVTYTLSGNIGKAGSATNCYLDVQYYYANGVLILDGDQTLYSGGLSTSGPSYVHTETAPAGTSYGIVRLVVDGSSNTSAYAQRIKLEQGSQWTGYDDTASVSSQATALSTLSGQAYSSYTLTATAGNNISGMKLLAGSGPTNISSVIFDANSFQIWDGSNTHNLFSVTGGATSLANVAVNGNLLVSGSVGASALNVNSLSAISANIGTVTSGLLQSPNGNSYLDLNNARIVFNNGTYMKVTGTGFGANGDLLDWYGPTMPVSSCTKANAIMYLDTSSGELFYNGNPIGALATLNKVGSSNILSGVLLGSIIRLNMTANTSGQIANQYTAGAGTITVTADFVPLFDSTGRMIVAQGVNLSMGAAAAIGANGCDNSAAVSAVESAGAFLHVYMISDGTNEALILSTNSTAPTLPGSYAYYQRLGAVRVYFGAGGGSNAILYPTVQLGQHAQIINIAQGSIPVLMASGNAGNGSSWTAVSVSGSFIPSTATHIWGILSTSGGKVAYAAPNTNYSLGGSYTNPPFVSATWNNVTAPVSQQFRMFIEPASSGNIYWTSNYGSGNLICTGWDDNIAA